MASKEPIENPNTPNVNFIGFQKQLREIIKDIKHFLVFLSPKFVATFINSKNILIFELY